MWRLLFGQLLREDVACKEKGAKATLGTKESSKHRWIWNWKGSENKDYYQWGLEGGLRKHWMKDVRVGKRGSSIVEDWR